MSETVEGEDTDWTDPEACPFCGDTLRNGGAGFVEHAETNPECMRRFDEWRTNVGGDMGPVWSG